jgi:hypothetical protein
VILAVGGALGRVLAGLWGGLAWTVNGSFALGATAVALRRDAGLPWTTSVIAVLVGRAPGLYSRGP